MPRSLGKWVLAGLMAACARASAIDVILNEFNAVGSTRFLENSSSDTFFGTIRGNGFNWVELVVTTDHADLRGYSFRWAENGGDSSGVPIWDATRPTWEQGTITLTNHSFWSNLRAGTIITLIEQEVIDTVDANLDPVQFNMATDLSFDPLAGDWHVNISTQGETLSFDPLLSTETNVNGGLVGDFTVGNDDWEFRIVDDLGSEILGIGERLLPTWAANHDLGAVNSMEVGKLEVNPSGTITNSDFNDGDDSTFGSENGWMDLSQRQDFSGLRAKVVPELPGDANLDGMVTGADYTIWADNFGLNDLANVCTGDFNADGDVTGADYTIWADNFGMSSTAVPEPGTLALALVGLLGLGWAARRRA